jgi:hypothetical protein
MSNARELKLERGLQAASAGKKKTALNFTCFNLTESEAG